MRTVLLSVAVAALPGCLTRALAGDKSTCPDGLYSCPQLLDIGPIEGPAGIVVAAPVAVTPAQDGGLAVNTSLSSWRDYNSGRVAEKAGAVRGDGTAARLKGARPPLPVDVWTRVQIAEPAGTSAHGVRYEAGAETKLGSRATFGVSGAIADPPAAGGAVGGDPMRESVGARAFFVVLPALSIEAKGRWSAAGDGTSSKDAQEKGSQASEVTLAPRLGQKFALPGGGSVEPFVMVESGIEPHAGTTAVSPKAASGVTFDQPNSYSLSFSTTIDDVSAPEQAPVNSRVQLKIPLR